MPRTRSHSMAYTCRVRADIARAKGDRETAEALERVAATFDPRNATIPGTMPCVRLEAR